MRVGKIRQFWKLQDEGDVLTTVGSVEVSGLYAGGDESTQFIGACLSLHPEFNAHDCGLGGGE